MIHLEQLVHCVYVSQKQLLNEMTCNLGICTLVCPVWARSNRHLSLHFPTFYCTYQYLLLFPFSLSYSLNLFPCFSIAFPSTRRIPLCFQARYHIRRLNLALVLFYFFTCYGCMLVFVVFDLVFSCSVIVLSPCCRR